MGTGRSELRHRVRIAGFSARGERADGTFGQGFFDRLARVEVGQWRGPIASAYGSHLVRVHLIAPGHQPPFDEMREQVEKDWRRAKAQELYAALLSRYEVERPGAARAPAE